MSASSLQKKMNVFTNELPPELKESLIAIDTLSLEELSETIEWKRAELFMRLSAHKRMNNKRINIALTLSLVLRFPQIPESDIFFIKEDFIRMSRDIRTLQYIRSGLLNSILKVNYLDKSSYKKFYNRRLLIAYQNIRSKCLGLDFVFLLEEIVESTIKYSGAKYHGKFCDKVYRLFRKIFKDKDFMKELVHDVSECENLSQFQSKPTYEKLLEIAYRIK